MSVELTDDVVATAGEFIGRVIADFGGLAAIALWSAADELGLLSVLDAEPCTATEAAARCHIDPRSAFEILAGLAAAGYLARTGEHFALPSGHAAVLRDGTPFSAAGGAAEIGAILRMWSEVVGAARTGAGIDPLSYPRQFHDGMQRLNAPIYTVGFPTEGVTHIDGLRDRLGMGATVADVGCGNGLALVGLAQTYRSVRCVGFDLDPTSVEVARTNAAHAGVGDRVRFDQADASAELGGPYDVVLAFDMLHDSGDPVAVVASLRKALADDGFLVVLEPMAVDDPAQDVGPMAALLRLFSIGYCLPVATHHGDARLGTAGLSPARLEALLREAGFGGFAQVPWQAGFNAMYVARPR
jgi:2-polyprenyl-3-methyl-5-hydroxy-6-metoxy-1,4-benzoquinol methylase